MTKPREFWIEKQCNGDTCIEHNCHVFSSKTSDCYNVIEKSAADKLAAALKEIINTKSEHEESNYLAQHYKEAAIQALREYRGED